MPRKTEFKMLDKTGTRFPTIREARLREQWRANSRRYYAKKKLDRELARLAHSEEAKKTMEDILGVSRRSA